jgi:putative spermidine/putrescine transport system ATP-binding protein
MQGTTVRFDKVSKWFGATAALTEFSLDVAPGEFVTLLGASGSGKSTALNILAGFSEATSGDVRIGERSLAGVPSEDRNVGMVFQNFALFPHMSVFDNIAFPLKMRRTPAGETRKLVMDALDLVHLSGLSDRRPAALSGGQRQRVALARAVVFSPPVLLMDECLSALDLKLREELQGEVRRIHHEIGATTVFVTHDQGEALTMSDRVAVLKGGRIEQIDRPEVLYDRPATRYVADFIGQTNLMDATPVPGGVRVAGIGATLAADRPDAVAVSLRPERIARAEALRAQSGVVSFSARLRETVFMGATLEHHFRLADGGALTMRESRSGAVGSLEAGAQVALAFRNRDAVVLTDT